MKWREIATYLLLYRAIGEKKINYFKILSFLRLFYDKKSAQRELKRLINLGLLVRNGDEFKVIDIEEFIRKKIIPYIILRMKRRLKNIDKDVEILLLKDRIKIICRSRECVRYIEARKEELLFLPLKISIELIE